MPLTEESLTKTGGEAKSELEVSPEQANLSNVLSMGPSDNYTDTREGSPLRKKQKRVQFPEGVPITTSKEVTRISVGDVNSAVSEGVTDVEGVNVEEGVNVGECMTDVDDMNTCMARVKEELNQLQLKWKETLEESESFERFLPARMDELLKEALAVEEQLIQQKEQLRSRLQRITQTLGSM